MDAIAGSEIRAGEAVEIDEQGRVAPATGVPRLAVAVEDVHVGEEVDLDDLRRGRVSKAAGS